MDIVYGAWIGSESVEIWILCMGLGLGVRVRVYIRNRWVVSWRDDVMWLEMSEYREWEECGIGGDILEEMMSHVPLVDLVSAKKVSSTWRSAICRSIGRLNSVKPWLMIHSHSTRSPSAVTTLAYDPRSQLWMELRRHPASIHYFSLLRSSHSSLLYMLSPSRFAFSVDPLHLDWHQAPPPPTGWRPDPVVAAVGNHIIVAGSSSSIGIRDDQIPPLEIYDTTTRTWKWCDSMPSELMDSAAATWLSVAVEQHKMYVCVKSSGVTYSFDPMTNKWCGPYEYDLGADDADEESAFYSVIGFGGEGLLVLVSLTGEAEHVRSIVMRVLEIHNDEAMEINSKCKCRCKWKSKMPVELLDQLKGDQSEYMPSISLNVMRDFVFIHNPLEPRLVLVCHLLQGTSRWETITAPHHHHSPFRNSVLSCSKVTLPHLDHAFELGLQHFSL